jgi:glycine betaine catabolism B
MRELDVLTAPDVDGQLICRAVLPVTRDVKTFVLSAPSPRLFSFQPGQYLTVTTPAGSRCYTISSPPTRPHLLAITVKRSPGGAVSNWLHDKLLPGERISAEGPYPSGSVLSVPVGGQRDHAADVDDADVVRPGFGRRRYVRALGADTRRRDLRA